MEEGKVKVLIPKVPILRVPEIKLKELDKSIKIPKK